MEPFGLFQFLQNLLTSPTANNESSTAEAPSPTPPAEKEKMDAAARTRTEFSTSQNEAVLQFFSTHDERVKRTKQKQ